ncbi:EamA family transporter [Granulicella sp. dw_53]|uniref:EamA family transporter n=1 Tax=Granulicella sp. dw_53 TaxID=2719792 RepID=UPI001BD3A805|nr:EamA family transporter [Granulicella sp. dw_53]
MTHSSHHSNQSNVPTRFNRTTPPPAFIIVAFACVYFFWGSTYTAIRIGAAQLPPFVLTGVRFCVAGAILLFCCRLRRLSILLPLRTLVTLSMIGLLLLTVGNTTLVYAEKSIPSGLASLIFAATPLFIALIEMALPHGEPLNLRGWLGILLGFLGMVTLLGPTLHEVFTVGLLTNTTRLIAILVCLGGALSWAIGSLYSRHQRLNVDSFVSSAWQMIFAGFFNLLLATMFGQWPQAHWNVSTFGSLTWLITGGSLIGYSSYIYLLEHVPVAKVATYAYINPIVAVLLGLLLLHERMQAAEFVGMALIILAVALLTSATIKRKSVGGKAQQEPMSGEQLQAD